MSAPHYHCTTGETPTPLDLVFLVKTKTPQPHFPV